MREQQIFGYIRVSAKDQNIDRQLDALAPLGIPKRNRYIDKQSGKTSASARRRASRPPKPAASGSAGRRRSCRRTLIYGLPAGAAGRSRGNRWQTTAAWRSPYCTANCGRRESPWTEPGAVPQTIRNDPRRGGELTAPCPCRADGSRRLRKAADKRRMRIRRPPPQNGTRRRTSPQWSGRTKARCRRPVSRRGNRPPVSC